MMFSENRCPSSDQVRGQAFSGSCSKGVMSRLAFSLYGLTETCRQCAAWGSVVSSETVLETEDLTKEFAGFVAVRAVNLRVARGGIHALIGPNGAGKTTVFNLLSKFLSPTRGRIVFDGRDVTALRP